MEPHDPPPTGPLRLVHRGVRLLDELIDGRAVRGADRHADRDRGPDGLAGEFEGGGNGVDGPLGNGECLIAGGELLEQQRELVTAQAGDRIRRPNDRAQSLRHEGQEPVTPGVAEHVVHRLEVVEVDEQDGDGCSLPTRQPGEGMLDSVMEEAAVGEAGERVVERPVAELVIEPTVLDRHGRLERQRAGERESTLVDWTVSAGRQLGNTDRLRQGDERQEEHDLATEGPQACLFGRVGQFVSGIDDDPRPVMDDAPEQRPLHERFRIRLEGTFHGVRPEWGESAGLRREGVDDAVVEAGRFREVPGDELTEHGGLGRLGEVG